MAKNVKDNPKSFWRYVGSKTQRKPKIPDLHLSEESDEFTKDDKEKAEVLGIFFC